MAAGDLSQLGEAIFGVEGLRGFVLGGTLESEGSPTHGPVGGDRLPQKLDPDALPPVILPDPEKSHPAYAGLGSGQGGKLKKAHRFLSQKDSLDRTGIPKGLLFGLS